MNWLEAFLLQKHRLQKNKSSYSEDYMEQFPEQIMPDGESGFFCVAGFCFLLCCPQNTSRLKNSGTSTKGNGGSNRKLRRRKFAASADLMNSGGNLCDSGKQSFCFDRKNWNLFNPRSKNGKQHNITADYDQCITCGHQDFVQGTLFYGRGVFDFALLVLACGTVKMS